MAYLAPGRLPHLLPPAAYHEAGYYAREQATVFAKAWRFVGTLDEIPRNGDYLTRPIGGLPLIVRNLWGEVRSFSNVCAHRHCLLRSQRYGAGEQLRCPYHGWLYDSAGRVKSAPDAEHFHAPGGGRPALARYRTALCGRLIFVLLAESGPSLKRFMGEMYDVCAERFGDDWRQSLALDLDYRANWKVAVENTLESYHASQLHRATFGGDPGEARSHHLLAPDRTEISTRLEGSRWVARTYQGAEAAVLRMAGERPTANYRHVHIFPNLTVSFTDTGSFIQSMEPVSPTGADGLVRQFVLSRRAWPGWRRGLLWTWGRAGAALTRKIVREDLAIYPALQRGLEGSPHPGLLGRNEERIHAFQTWLTAQLAQAPAGVT